MATTSKSASRGKTTAKAKPRAASAKSNVRSGGFTTSASFFKGRSFLAAFAVLLVAAFGAHYIFSSSADTNRASGLPWSSGVWAHDEPGQVNKYVSVVRGGVPVDNVMEYTWRDSRQSQINSIPHFAANMPTGFTGSRDDFVLSVTTRTGDGAYVTGADGAQIGTNICKVDSSPIVRLNWEMNLGGQGEGLDSGNFNSWVARFREVSKGIKSTCPQTRIDFNPNHGQDQTSGCQGSPATWCSRRAFQQLKDVVDIYGLDTYDAWNSIGGVTEELSEGYSYAQSNGKTFSVPEWGVAIGSYGAQARGDDPAFINAMTDWFSAHSKGMAYETYFNEPASYIVSDLVNNNPNSRKAMAAKIKQYKGTGGGGTTPPPVVVPPTTGGGGTTGTITQTGNLLAGKTPVQAGMTDSTTEAGNPLTNVVDGNEATRWISTPVDNGYVTFDLKTKYTLNKMSIKWAGDTTNHYTIEVLNDKGVWTQVFGGQTTGSQSDYENPAFTGVGTQVRIHFIDRWNAAYGNSIFEIAAYGTPVSTTTPPVTPPSTGGGSGTSGSVSQTGNVLKTAKFNQTGMADSTIEPGNPLANVVDANESTRWISTPVDGGYVTATLGGNYNLTGMAIKWAGDTTKNYTVEVLNANGAWTQVAASATSGTQNFYKSLSFAATGTQVRIHFLDRWNAAYGNSIYEIAAYGTAATGSTPKITTGPVVGIAGKCLDNSSSKVANNNKIQLWTCNGTGAQKWVISTAPAKPIKNSNGYCLDTYKAGTAALTKLVLYTCNGSTSQQWTVDASNGHIKNAKSGLYLHDASSGTANGNPIVLWTNSNSAAQTWSWLK